MALPLNTGPSSARMSLLDLSVANSDIGLILRGIFYALVLALPTGYGTGVLTTPYVPDVSVIGLIVDVAQIVLFEEILFRAYLFGWLRSRMHLQTAAVLSAVVFGLLHLIKWPMPMAIIAAWVGYVLAIFYHKSGRISTPMLIHAVLIIIQLFTLHPSLK